MSHADREFEFLRRLREETDLWLREGLITKEQQQNILMRYHGLKEADEKAGPGKLVATIAVLGAILIGLGIILFIAANWSEIPRWGKLGIIYSSMLISYAAGYFLRFEKKNYPKVGASLILLGSMIFGAGIFLIAQIYHITVHYPNGPLLWGLGVLPLAYLLGFRTILSLATIDLLIWLGMESSFHLSWGFGDRAALVVLYLMTGAALWSTGLMHRGFPALRRIAGPYIVIGVLVTFAAGFVLTFDVYTESMGSARLMLFYAGITLLFLASIATFALSREKEKGWVVEALGLVFVMAAAAALILFHTRPAGVPYAGNSDILMISSNVSYAMAIIGLIVLGYLRRYTAYINIGLLFFVLDVTARYFDFFWELLPRSVFFIIGGVILLLGGVMLEKKRRKVLAAFALKDER